MKTLRGSLRTLSSTCLSARQCLSCVLASALLAGPALEGEKSAAAAAHPALGDKKAKPEAPLKGLPITELSADEAILHALNRLAYGPRPGDVERVKQMGLARWIDLQLNPGSLEDKPLEARLENLPTLRLNAAALIAAYPQPKQAAKLPPAPARQAPNGNSPDLQESMPAAARDGNQTADGADIPSPMKQPSGNPASRGAGKRAALGSDPNFVPGPIADDSRRPARIIEELAMAKLTRAIYSDRQLQQVMDDFWFNHFNVFAGKGEDRYYLTAYEREVIEPHALGKFRDLLTATAKSPAMLFYLDNFLSADPLAAQRLAQQRARRQQRFGRFPGSTENSQRGKKRPGRGLNENYGRELMELHTVGVDGGYTQKDVTEVARAFTGWTIEKPRENPQFKFDERIHDPEPKVVLGKKIRAGGMKDGQQVIELLAKHPNTARFIATKLARRFVSDQPPPALVARMADRFRKSDGDIREVLRTMIYAPEFWSRNAYRAKIKTPLEFVASTVRALGTDVDTTMPLVQWVGRIGQPLYQCQPPTGYSDKAEAWVNAGALLNRLNFSLALAGNKVRGSRSDAAALLAPSSSADTKEILDRAIELFLGGQAGPATIETLKKQLDDPQVIQARLDDPAKSADLGVITGLVLGAPEFQRR